MPEPGSTPERANANDLARVLIATILFSFLGPVSRLVALDVGAISFYRALFAALALGVALFIRGKELLARAPGRAWAELFGLGLLMCGNWYFYLLAIEVSNVAVAVVSLFTYPLFTSLLEPVLFGERYRAKDLLAGCLVFSGIAVVVERVSLADSTLRGVIYGLLSSLSLTFRNVFSRRALERYSAESLNLAQFSVALLVFAPFALQTLPKGAHDWIVLVVIGSVLTAASWVLFTAALRRLTTTTASFLVSLQPVFATLIAWPLLGQVPGIRTVLGGFVILAGVLLALSKPASRGVAER
ncbi:MAG: DMT family transporter [Myxococcota bacterium]